MIHGIELTNGVTTITVAPQNLRIYFSDEATKAREDAASGTLTGDEFLKVMERNILACARRNHPNLTLEELREVLDTADIERVNAWCMKKSGLQSGPLAVAADGAAASPSPAPNSSGTSSTPQAGSPTISSTG